MLPEPVSAMPIIGVASVSCFWIMGASTSLGNWPSARFTLSPHFLSGHVHVFAERESDGHGRNALVLE